MFRGMRIGLNSPLLKRKAIFAVGSTAGILASQSGVWANVGPIRNDQARAIPVLQDRSIGSALREKQQELKPQYDGAFNGKLNYQELSIGSFVGLATGIIVGKLSHVLWAVTLSTYLLLQWLNSRHIIDFKIKKVIRFGTSQIDINKMVFERPSFNITFLLAFVVSAWNV